MEGIIAMTFKIKITENNKIETSEFESQPIQNPYIGADFGIRISGDSMKPVVENGKKGFFIFDSSAYCKRLRVDHELCAVFLDSINKAYAPIKVPNPDDLKTVGIVL
jgi:phage repressor protein C with HTH and peptisase S24 domain